MDSVPTQLKYHRPEREREGERGKCETERYGQCTCTAKVP